MYALNPPLPPNFWTTATHRRRTTRLHEQSRVFCEQKKKKLPSTCPKLLRQQLSCDAWRGVKGHHRPSLLVTAIVRTEPTMHLLETILVQTRYSTSIYIFEQLCAQFYIRFIIRGRRGEREILSPLSLFPSLRKDPLPYFHWRDLKGCSSGRKAR